MIRYTAKRLLAAVPVAFGVTIVVFGLLRLVPGDPAEAYLGLRANPALLKLIRKRFGLNKSIPEQYVIFIGHVFRGDLGTSYYYRQPVVSVILGRLPTELYLMGFATLLGVMLAVPLAALSAVKRESPWDNGVRIFMVLGFSVPIYWLGSVMIIAFGVSLRLFPVGGYQPGVIGHLRSLFLPALAIAVGISPVLIRALRASLIEALRSEYLDMARAKGLPRQAILWNHAFRNALIPAVTMLGLNISFLVGGMVTIEVVFGIPGLGNLLVNAITTRDYPTVQGTTLIFATLIVLINLATDLVVALLDPRVRASLNVQ